MSISTLRKLLVAAAFLVLIIPAGQCFAQDSATAPANPVTGTDPSAPGRFLKKNPCHASSGIRWLHTDCAAHKEDQCILPASISSYGLPALLHM